MRIKKIYRKFTEKHIQPYNYVFHKIGLNYGVTSSIVNIKKKRRNIY